MVTTAHYFTFFRILISPLFPIFYLKFSSFGISLQVLPFLLLVILTLCEFSDIFDGFIARKKGEVTDLGKILDPIADSITRITIFFTFTQGFIGIPMLWVFVFLYRDFLISALRTVCALKGYALAARKSGKLKAIFQGGSAYIIVLCMIPYSWGALSLEMLQNISYFLVVFTSIYTLASAFDYFIANRGYIKKIIQGK